MSGVGLDVPVWIRRLEEALRQTRAKELPDTDETIRLAPGLDFEKLRRQLADWDKPIGE